MMIIAFAPKSSKVMANLLCKDIKHVAPIEILDDAFFNNGRHPLRVRQKAADGSVLMISNVV